MVDQLKSLDERLKEIELANAQVTLKLEQRKLRWWYVVGQIFASPALLAGVVTAAITVGFNWYSENQAQRQRHSEALRLQQESDKNILLGVIGRRDPESIASELHLFLDAGVIYDRTHFEDVIQNLEEHSRQEILRNIVLASRDLPLNFDPGVNLSQLDKPIDLQTWNFLIRDGYPRELLLYLFVDSFHLQNSSSPYSELAFQYDPPDSYGCARNDPGHRCFRQWVWTALLTGLTVEEKAVVTKLTSKFDTIHVVRFCFSPELASEASEEMGRDGDEIWQKFGFSSHPSPVCGTWQDKDVQAMLTHPEPDTFAFDIGGAILRIVPRSIVGVFEFLGNLVKMQRENIQPAPGKAFFWPPPLGEPDEAVVPPTLKTVDGRPPLITVIPKSATSNCFVSAGIDNVDYCVPNKATLTKRLFGMLTQLITTQTE